MHRSPLEWATIEKKTMAAASIAITMNDAFEEAIDCVCVP
jgi:hypothetical protein